MSEEECVEGYGFGKGHSEDGLDKNLAEGSWITADGFGGFEANEADANGCAEAAEAALDTSGDFSDGEVHFIYGLLVAVPSSTRLAWSRR